MTILALDISTKATGIAVFKDGELVYSSVATAASANVYDRIAKITAEVERVFVTYRPDYVIAEEPEPAFVKNNIDVYRKLTFAHGDICMMLNRYKKKMEWCTSSHWRKLVGIKTGAGVKRESLKSLDIAKVNELYSKKCGDDEADAILIGLAYYKEHGKEINFE